MEPHHPLQGCEGVVEVAMSSGVSGDGLEALMGMGNLAHFMHIYKTTFFTISIGGQTGAGGGA